MSNQNTASRNVGSLAKIVDEVSFQADLLALSASVEMAGTGQHGLEFARLAGELRRLAHGAAEVRDSSFVEQESAF